MVGGLANFARCEPRTTLADGVQGNIEFKTLTLTSDQLLAGSTAGPDVLISGYLSFPKNRDRVPAIIISHGAGGISSTEAGWADELRSMGVATFLVDSFSGRGRTKFPREEVLSQRGQVLDLYRALALLTTHPRIDARRIALMGCSRGGGVAILAAESVRSPHFPPNADVAAYLAVYPTLPSDVDFSSWQLPARPIRVFQGLLDNVTPVDIARRFVAAQRAKGIDVRMFEYPNARHVFDNPALPPLVETRIGTIGYNGLAAAQAVKDMKKSLTEIFGLK